MHKCSVCVASLLAITLILAAPFSRGADKRFEKTLPAKPGGTLTLTTDVGSISITGGDVSEVSVVAEIKGRERDIDEYVVNATGTSNGVEVKGELSKKHRSFWRSVNLDVQFAVKVPREYSLALNTSGGNIDVADISGTIMGETSGGNVTILNTVGDAKMETSGGNVKADRGRGNLVLRTSGGDASASDFTGDIHLTTSGGNVNALNVDGMVRAQTSGGSVKVTLSGSNKGVHAETSGGSILVAVPKDLKADLDLATSGGEVVCDLPVTVQGKIQEYTIRGSVNAGGKLIWAHTSGGDVRIVVKE
jgi:hypothetical protein